jgi:hypothetical protein
MTTQYICTICGSVGSPKRLFRGYFWIESGLWLAGLLLVAFFFSEVGFLVLVSLLPGLSYSVWRETSRYNACPKCKNASVIPLDTPVGQELFLKHHKLPENHS